MTILILFIFWILFSIFLIIFIFTFYSKVSLDYTNNKLEKEIRMNIYDRKENFEIKINKENLEIAKKTAYEMNYIIEEHRLNDSFPFRKCEDSFEIGFMKWLTSQDLDWVLKNHFVDIIETFKKNIKINERN